MQVNIPAPWVASGIELEEAFRFGFPLTLGSLGSRFGCEDPPREKKMPVMHGVRPAKLLERGKV